jgi:hypothetical protein
MDRIVGKIKTGSTFRGTGVPADLDPPQNEPTGPNPLANMDLWGSLFASGFGLPSRIWTLAYFIIATYCILNIVLKAF